MKKLLLSVFTFFLATGCAFASTIKDVPTGYWAEKEIKAVVKAGVINQYDDKTFKPEAVVNRAQFNSMLLRALGHQQDASLKATFDDVQANYWAYGDIAKSQEIGLIYGYPNNKFLPEKTISKTEAASIISHITKGDAKDPNILNSFKDGAAVVAWGANQYAKTIEYDIYVNYPNSDELLPNKNLNRAEAAVLLYKLQQRLGLVKDDFVATEVLLSTEHLNVSADAKSNEVRVTNKRRIVALGNVLNVSFQDKFNSKYYNVGDEVKFDVNEDINTVEGTLVIPAGSEFTAVITDYVAPKMFNKNAEVTLAFKEVKFPCGAVFPLDAKVMENDGVLRESKLATAGKILAWTAGGTAVGTGAGVGFSFIPEPDKVGTGVAIGTPVGAGVGLVAGLVTPGLLYKAYDGEQVLIELTSDLSICNPKK